MTEQEKIQRMREIYSLMCEYLPYAEYMTTGYYEKDSDDYDKLHDVCYQFTVDIDMETLKEKVFGQEYKDADLGDYWEDDEIFGWCCAIVKDEQLYMHFGNDETQSDYNNVTVESIFSDNALERIEEALKIFTDSLDEKEIYVAGEYYSTQSGKANSWQKYMLSPALAHNPRLLKHSRNELKKSLADGVDKNNTLRARSILRADGEKLIYTAVVIKKDYTVEIVDLFDEPLPEYNDDDDDCSYEFADINLEDNLEKIFGKGV